VPNGPDFREVIKKSLSPAEVIKVDIIDEEEREAIAYILPTERARALGKNGLNINLASKLT
jgi:transcription antitermination factor NusA-like protein